MKITEYNQRNCKSKIVCYFDKKIEIRAILIIKIAMGEIFEMYKLCSNSSQMIHTPETKADCFRLEANLCQFKVINQNTPSHNHVQEQSNH